MPKAPAPKAPTRLRDLAEKGGYDVLYFDPRKIKVEPGHNVRNFDTPEMAERLAALKESIRTKGFWQHAALLLRFDAGEAYLVDGETRLRAVMALIEEGLDIVSIPVISVKANNERERLLISLAANTGRPLEAIELGAAFQRLTGFGMTPQEIASTLGYSLPFVNIGLSLFDTPEEVKSLVKAKEVTPARAVSEVKKRGSSAAASLREEVAKKKAKGAKGPVTRSRQPQRFATPPVAAGSRAERQETVAQWVVDAFGALEGRSLPQRGLRHAEEAVEAAHAAGTPRGVLHQLIDAVYDKPKGALRQELGGSGITLLALAAAAGIDADHAEAEEAARVLSKPLEYFAARNKAKNDAGFLAVGNG